MLNRRSISPIGIDMGHQNIYAAQLRPARQGFHVRGLFHRRIEEAEEGADPKAVILSAFKEIKKDKRFTGKRVVIHLPPQSVFRFPIRFQMTGEESMEEAILRESRGYLPFPLEEAVLDYPSLVPPKPGDGSPYRAMIVAVRRDEIQQYVGLLKQAGLVLEAVDFSLSSLIRLHTCFVQTDQNPVLLCHIGDTRSMLAVVTADSMLAQRYVSWGIGTLIQKLLAAFNLGETESKAETLLKEYGLLFEDRQGEKKSSGDPLDAEGEEVSRAIYQILSPHVEELIHELHKTIGYVRSEGWNAPAEGLYLYGYATYVRYLDHYLERRLNIPTRLMNPVSKMLFADESILPDKTDGAPFGLALGLAMRRL
jgi:type IV pilus assembly protein PilM